MNKHFRPDAITPRPDPRKALQFLLDLPGDQINLSAIHKNGGAPTARSFGRSEEDQSAARQFIDKAQRHGFNVYFNINHFAEPLGPKHPKGTESEVVRVHAFLVDVDLPKDTPQAQHATKRAELLAGINAVTDVPPPTFIIDSGNGYWTGWVLAAPIDITADNRDQIKAYNIALAARFGGDSCENLDRLARVPFTVNYPNPPKVKLGRVPVLAGLVEDNPIHYTLDDFTPAAPPPPPKGPRAAGTGTKEPPTGNEFEQIGSPDIPESVDLGRLDADLVTLIKTGPAGDEAVDRSGRVYFVACSLRRAGLSDGAIIHVITNPSYWISGHILDQRQRAPHVQAARVILRMNAEGLAYTTAAEDFGDPAPDPEAAAAAAATAAADKKAKAKKREKQREAQKQTRPYDGETWESLRENFVYVGQQEAFVRLEDGQMWSVQAFKRQFGYVATAEHFDEDLTDHIFQCMPDVGMKMYDSFCYLPGADQATIGARALNQWKPSPIVPKENKAKLALWHEHLIYLFPDETERGYVLNWCAWVYVFQHLHPKHALLIHGKVQGTGKTLLFNVMAKLIGEHNVTRITQRQLTDLVHNAWALRTKLLLIEEIRPAYASKKVEAELHALISEPVVHVDIKMKSDFDMNNVMAAGAGSNCDDAVTMDDSDRRYLTVSTDRDGDVLQPRGVDYYRQLYGKNGVGGLLNDPEALAAIAWELAQRDLGNYAGTDPAPYTAAKGRMLAATKSELEQYMVEEMADQVPLTYRLVTIESIVAIMPEDIRRNTRNIRNVVGGVLKRRFKGQKLGRPRIDGEQLTVWSINGPPPEGWNKEGELARVYQAERPHKGQKSGNDIG